MVMDGMVGIRGGFGVKRSEFTGERDLARDDGMGVSCPC